MAALEVPSRGARLCGSEDFSSNPAPKKKERFYSVFGNAETGNFIFCVDKNATFIDQEAGSNTHYLLIKRFGHADASSHSYIVNTLTHKRLSKRECKPPEIDAMKEELAEIRTKQEEIAGLKKPEIDEGKSECIFFPYETAPCISWKVTNFQQEGEAFERDVDGFKSPMNAVEVAKFRAVLGEDDFDRDLKGS